MNITTRSRRGRLAVSIRPGQDDSFTLTGARDGKPMSLQLPLYDNEASELLEILRPSAQDDADSTLEGMEVSVTDIDADFGTLVLTYSDDAPLSVGGYCTRGQIDLLVEFNPAQARAVIAALEELLSATAAAEA